MLENICIDIIECLREAGLDARYMYSGGDIRAIKGTVVLVGISGVQAASSGFGDFLGMMVRDDLTAEEIYGLECDISLAMDICVSANDENCALKCVQTFDKAIGALSALKGLRIKSMSMGEGTADAKSGLYKCRYTAKGSAYIIACDEDGTAFTDFVLKGVLKK